MNFNIIILKEEYEFYNLKNEILDVYINGFRLNNVKELDFKCYDILFINKYDEIIGKIDYRYVITLEIYIYNGNDKVFELYCNGDGINVKDDR